MGSTPKRSYVVVFIALYCKQYGANDFATPVQQEPMESYQQIQVPKKMLIQVSRDFFGRVSTKMKYCKLYKGGGTGVDVIVSKKQDETKSLQSNSCINAEVMIFSFCTLFKFSYLTYSFVLLVVLHTY